MSRHTFRHEAMATFFEIVVADQPEPYARQASAAAFRELDRLESELSRFVESSDIARVNRLRRDEATTVGEATLDCLLLAADVALATQRAFDPAYGSDRGNLPPDALPFTLDPDAHAVTSLVPRLRLDLGAVGKGYALDRMAAVLNEWQIAAACLNSGGSTVLTMAAPAGEPGWKVGFGDAGRTIVLRDAALSGSGTAVQGAHLIEPRTALPASRTSRAWSLAAAGAEADALSTAFFVMTDPEIVEFCRAHPSIGAAMVDSEGRLALYGTLTRY